MSTLVHATMADAISNAKRTAVAPMVWNPTEHLLSRASFGPTAYTRSWVNKYGPDAWLKQQIKYCETYAGYIGKPQVTTIGPLLSMQPSDLRRWLSDHGNQFGWTAMDQLTRVTLGLQGWSPAQLYEVLVDFFSNHLNVANHDTDVWNTRHTHDRDVIRKYATGSFTDMLLASAKNPAMLIYLNLAGSSKTAVNENYGRELLELHTVGLHYSEDDVKNAAKILTGRTFDRNYDYIYNDYMHWTGPIKVLGFSHANSSAASGEAAGDAMLRYLAAHPDTAQNLARKLCVRLVSDNPSNDLVAAVAKAYLDNKTQILPTVSTILCSTEFWESRGRKVRRPSESVLATIRTLGVYPASSWAAALDQLSWMTTATGQVPLDWPAPNGYPDVAQAWRSASTFISNCNYRFGFAAGWWDGFAKVDLESLYGSPPVNSGDAIDKLTRRITGQAWTSAHRAILQNVLGEPASTPMSSSKLVVSWMVVPIAAIILDGPHHALR